MCLSYWLQVPYCPFVNLCGILLLYLNRNLVKFVSVFQCHVLSSELFNLFLRCYNCGGLDHHAKECKLPPQPKRCHFCQSISHMVASCPVKAQQSSPGSQETPSSLKGEEEVQNYFSPLTEATNWGKSAQRRLGWSSQANHTTTLKDEHGFLLMLRLELPQIIYKECTVFLSLV